MARKENWCIVEEYEFYNGSSDMQAFTYVNKTMALLALKPQYEELLKIFRNCGFEIEDSYLGDNTAWMTMKDGTRAKMRVCRLKPINR